LPCSFEMAYAKAQLAANQRLPLKGSIFVSMNDALKERSIPVVQGFAELGFKIYATGGTAAVLKKAGIAVHTVLKLHEGRPHIGTDPSPTGPSCKQPRGACSSPLPSERPPMRWGAFRLITADNNIHCGTIVVCTEVLVHKA
jgi:hypothetical protein